MIFPFLSHTFNAKRLLQRQFYNDYCIFFIKQHMTNSYSNVLFLKTRYLNITHIVYYHSLTLILCTPVKLNAVINSTFSFKRTDN